MSKQDFIARCREGKEAMATRCEAVAQVLAKEAGVKTWEYTRGLYGRASPKRKHIRAPRPTTRRRLYLWAHECAHVALAHVGKKPVHRQEYEAEQWAEEALRRHGVAVPTESVVGAKRYVAMKIRRAVKRGALVIDSDAQAFCKEYLGTLPVPGEPRKRLLRPKTSRWRRYGMTIEIWGGNRVSADALVERLRRLAQFIPDEDRPFFTKPRYFGKRNYLTFKKTPSTPYTLTFTSKRALRARSVRRGLLYVAGELEGVAAKEQQKTCALNKGH